MSLTPEEWETARRLGLEARARAGDERYLGLVRDVAAGRREDPGLPGVGRMVGEALSAATRVATAAITGAPVLADPGLRATRLALCRSCEYHRAADDRCSVCGCWTDGVAGKAGLKTEQCPLNRWPA